MYSTGEEGSKLTLHEKASWYSCLLPVRVPDGKEPCPLTSVPPSAQDPPLLRPQHSTGVWALQSACGVPLACSFIFLGFTFLICKPWGQKGLPHSVARCEEYKWYYFYSLSPVPGIVITQHICWSC